MIFLNLRGRGPALSHAADLGAMVSLDGLRDLRLDGVEVEARWGLQRRELNEALRKFRDDLLDQDEAPELVREPVVVSDGLSEAGALEGIEANVGQDRPIDLH